MSLTFCYVNSLLFAWSNQLLEVYDCLSARYWGLGLIWKMSCIILYMNNHIIYFSIDCIYTCITILDIAKYIHFLFVD